MICLFISPDLDGHRAPKNEILTLQRPRHVHVCLHPPDVDSLLHFTSRYVSNLRAFSAFSLLLSTALETANRPT
jgi:hypothetical protein